MTSRITGNHNFVGSVSFTGSLFPPSGSIDNRHISSDANNRIASDKLVHRYSLQYGQADGSDVVSATKLLRVCAGAGDLKGLEVRPTTAPTGGDKQFTVDVQKASDGSSSWTSLLSSAEVVDSSSVDDTLQTATLAGTTTTADGDALRVVITASGSTGSQGQGFVITAIYEEESS